MGCGQGVRDFYDMVTKIRSDVPTLLNICVTEPLPSPLLIGPHEAGIVYCNTIHETFNLTTILCTMVYLGLINADFLHKELRINLGYGSHVG